MSAKNIKNALIVIHALSAIGIFLISVVEKRANQNSVAKLYN